MEEFTAYNPFDQYTCISDRGVCLTGQQQGDVEVYLYGLEGFFVEIRFNSLLDRLEKITVFAGGPCLEFYLEQITLPVML
jgi:hypothetical protein